MAIHFLAILTTSIVVYFDQLKGAHPISKKGCFYSFSDKKVQKKFFLTCKRVQFAPFHWSKYTTFNVIFFRDFIALGLSMWELRYKVDDLTIYCDGTESCVPGHKIVLMAAASPILREKLQIATALCFPDTSKAVLESILEELYKGSQKAARRLESLPYFFFSKGMLSRTWKRELEQPSDLNPAKKQKTTKPVFLNSLPIEIICHILSYLTTTDILQKVACVSKQFLGLANDPSVHKNVWVKFNTSSSFLNFLMKATHMKKLHVLNQFVGDECIDDILPFIASHSKLRVFSLHHPIKVSCDTIKYLENSKWWSKLAHIDMTFNLIISASEFLPMITHLRGKANITRWWDSDLNYNLNIRGPTLSKLQSLTFPEHSCVMDFSLVKDIIMLGKDSLEEVKIQISSEDDKHLFEDFGYLSQVTNLTKLEITPVFSSFNLLPKLKKIQTLKINNLANTKKIRNDGWNIPANNFSSLTHLSVRSFPIYVNDEDDDDDDDDDDDEKEEDVMEVIFVTKNQFVVVVNVCYSDQHKN